MFTLIAYYLRANNTHTMDEFLQEEFLRDDPEEDLEEGLDEELDDDADADPTDDEDEMI